MKEEKNVKASKARQSAREALVRMRQRYRLEPLKDIQGIVAAFLGTDPQERVPVLVRMLRGRLSADPRWRERARYLGEILQALDHPNILPVRQAFEEGELLYFIAERVAATPLAERLGKIMDAEEALALVSQIAEALTYAARRGVVHGGLSPWRVLVDDEGRVKVADFGLAELVATGAAQVAEVKPLAAYQAPEVREGQPPTPRSDVYALGEILCALLTGEPLPPETLAQVPVLQRINEALNEGVAAVLRRALSPRPEERFRDAGEFVAALRKALMAAPVSASQEAPVETLPDQQVKAPPVSDVVSWDALMAEVKASLPMPEPPPMPSADISILEQGAVALAQPPPVPMPEPPPMPTVDWTQE